MKNTKILANIPKTLLREHRQINSSTMHTMIKDHGINAKESFSCKGTGPQLQVAASVKMNNCLKTFFRESKSSNPTGKK
jgi:hypothetical protein